MSDPAKTDSVPVAADQAANLIETAKMIFEGLALLLAIYKVVEPAFLSAFEDFRKLFESGEVTQADIDAFVARVNSQSAQIQA